MRILFLIIMLASVQTAHAQFWKKKRDSKERTQQPGVSNSLNPYYQPQHSGTNRAEKARRGKGATPNKTTYNAERTYYERVEAVAKTRKKNERLSMKPQYSDPSYFGHKRPPKKNPPHKMKFCKECGIRH